MLPRAVTSRIAEAGASAYQWRDSVLAALYVPPRPVQLAVRGGYWVLQVMALVGVVAVAAQAGVGVVLGSVGALVAVVVVLRFGLRRAVFPPPSFAWLVAAVVAAVPLVTSVPWGPVGMCVLAVAVIVSADADRPVRGQLSTWASVAVTLACGAFGGAASLAWVGVLVLVQVPICVVGRHWGTIWHRITPEDLAVRIPPPPFKWEGLALLIRRVARWLERVPGIGLLVSAFPSDGWLEGVVQGPADGVVSEAEKRAAGGYGERKTGVILLGLRRGRGTMILHDLVLPGADSANVDHVVVGTNREGRPCLFVIDSKFYGRSRLRGNDPGEVTYDLSTQEHVHRHDGRSREIDQSINTALWGAETVQRATGIEDVRVIMAIHNANVAPHLVFERRGFPVEIVSAWGLVERIESQLDASPAGLLERLRGGTGALTPMQEALLAQGLTSASTGERPVPVSPLGLTSEARRFLRSQEQQARGGEVVSFGESSSVPVQGSWVPEAWPEGGRAVESPAPMPETAFQRADREFFGPGGGEWADDAPVPMPVPPAESALSRVDALWEQMRNSMPAPPDDVPVEYQRIVRGTPLTITSFSDDSGPSAQDVVAITGVCVGAPGNLFLWFCSLEGWGQFNSSKTPVSISTIGIDRVIVREGGERNG